MATHPTKARPGAKEGAPPKYTKKLAEKVIAAMIKHKGLRAACENEKLGVHRETVLSWAVKTKEFFDQYCAAYEIIGQMFAEDTIGIAEEIPRIRQVVKSEKGFIELEVMDPAGLRRNDLRIKARQWMAARVARKVFGDKQEVTHQAGGSIADLITQSYKPEKTA